MPINTNGYLIYCFAVFAGVRLSCLFQAWQLLPIASVQSITNASPVLVMIISHFVFVDDPMTLIRTFCCGGYITGVLLIFQMFRSMGSGDAVSESHYRYYKEMQGKYA